MTESAAWFFIWIPKEIFKIFEIFQHLNIFDHFYGYFNTWIFESFLERRGKKNYRRRKTEEGSSRRTKKSRKLG